MSDAIAKTPIAQLTEKDVDSTYYGSNETPTKKTFGARLKAHYRRFWWLHLIVFVIVLLVITLPVVFVGYPHIAQDGVNDSTLEVQSIVFTNPTSDSFHLQQNGMIYSNNSYHPQLDSFNASFFLEDTEPNIKPFAYIQLPAVHATNQAPCNVNQTVHIADLAQFTAYTAMVLKSAEYRMAIRGRTGLHEMRFPETTVNYNKVLTLKGLNGLAGFNVTSFEIKLTPEPDGANMLGIVYIPNPSVMTLELGNVTMNLYVQGDFVGTSLLRDLTLVPGNNTVEMRSTTNQSLIIQKLANFKDGMLPVDIVGNSSVYNGQHLTYYEAALQSNEQHIVLNVGNALAAIGLGGIGR
ncbi:MAG: hypothetical protein M1827_004337 [Pycnora praestabilis]|nr:MAG: hypothetical protein M1827_004337 [Pycnora praestabilis]